MARRTDHTREELYEAALAAAWEIAESEGLRGLTARRIAGRIGYSPGTLYNIFEDLDDLVVHLLVRILDAMYKACAAAPPDPRPAKALNALAQAYISFNRDHPKLWGLLFEHHLPDGRELPDWYRAKVLRLLGLVETALAPLFAAGCEEARLHSARVLWGSLHGMSSLAAAEKLARPRPVADSSGETSEMKSRTEMLSALVESLVENYVAGLEQTVSRTTG